MDIAQSVLYKEVDFFPNPTANYFKEAESVMLERIVKAGYRLYYVLKDVFQKKTTAEL